MFQGDGRSNLTDAEKKLEAGWRPPRLTRTSFFAADHNHATLLRGTSGDTVRMKCAQKKQTTNTSEIMPDPSGHRSQRPFTQGQTCAKQE